MKITRVWATPVRPPAHYTMHASWLSESLIANPMSIYPRYKERRSSWNARWGHDVLVRVETVGPDAEIMLDCYMAWDLEFSLRMAEVLRPYAIRWIEECLPPDDYEGYAELTRRIEGMAVTTGEHEYTRWGFGELLARKCCHIIQPDLSWCGGISEARRIAALASTHGVPVIPHAGGLQPWGIHWISAQATIPWAEYVVLASPEDGELRPMLPFLRGVPQPRDGFLAPTDLPGLGIEVDEEWLEE